MKIELARSACASLAYEVLSALDLGRDAANLYQRKLLRPSWAAKLERAYIESGPERTAIQFAGLRFDNIDLLFEHAARRGSELWTYYAGALESERASLEQRLTASRAKDEARIALAREQIIDRLELLRAELWKPRPPPPLTVLHVPALRRAGRGLVAKSGHRVAVSLDEAWDHVWCQIFHEELHPIADRELGPMGARDTRGDEHLLIEANAVDRGEELIRRILPDALPAYERWCRAAR